MHDAQCRAEHARDRPRSRRQHAGTGAVTVVTERRAVAVVEGSWAMGEVALNLQPRAGNSLLIAASDRRVEVAPRTVTPLARLCTIAASSHARHTVNAE